MISEIAFLSPEWLPFSTLCFTVSMALLCVCFMILWLRAESRSETTEHRTEENHPNTDDTDPLEEYSDFVFVAGENYERTQSQCNSEDLVATESPELPSFSFCDDEVERTLQNDGEIAKNDFQFVIQNAQIIANLNGPRTPNSGKKRLSVNYNEDTSSDRYSHNRVTRSDDILSTSS